jgi:hypothetical protein
MAWKLSALVVLIALVGCTTGSSGEGWPPTSATVSTSTSTTSTTTTSPVSPIPGMVLASDGLGVVSFSDPVDDVMAMITASFGTPTYDMLYESPFDVPPGWHGDDRGPDACFVGTGTGYACYDYLRLVDWEEVGLWLVFADLDIDPEAIPGDDDYFVQVPPSLQGYDYGGGDTMAPLSTADGITIGSTSADLLALGDRVEFAWTECGGIVDFSITDTSGGFIWGTLDDADFEAFEANGSPQEGATVQYLHAGAGGSC